MACRSISSRRDSTPCRTRRRAHRPSAGFTYLWTLFAIAFIGVSMMLTAELWSTVTKRERERELIHVGRQFREAIGRYYEATPGSVKQYPASLDDLLKDPRSPSMRRHLRKVFLDPVTRSKDWGVVRLGGRIVGIHSLSKDAPLKTEGFLLSEVNFTGSEKYADWVFTYPADLVIQPEKTSKDEGKGFGGFGATSSVELQKLPDSSEELKDNAFGH
jgi:type II secretory pathway pseudopilin PulG